MSDHATRYPEAYPLRSISADRVAEKLVDLFSHHGVPKEILTDQGTNFTSALLRELYHMLGVKAITTSPYHPQTDGLVERFNQTLKMMLKKVLLQERRQWDKMLPMVLFAYREVPQEATGFSPFELMYNRDIQGPLDVLKESWLPGADEMNDVAEYVMRVRQRMEDAQDLVYRNLEQMQIKQKQWYDKQARELQLKVGDQVLLLLPDDTRKFTRKWQGPYRISQKLGHVNYEIEMPDKGRKQVFHVNLLKRWYPRHVVRQCNRGRR